MDVWFLAGFIMLIIIIVVYFAVIFILYINKNPQPTDVNIVNSVITHTSIGTRGDMGNQIFQLACVIATGQRSNATIVLPTRMLSLPIMELFDLTQFEIKDVIPNAVFREYDNYEEIRIPSDGRIYDIRGYRQAYKYFDDYSPFIRQIFTPKSYIMNAVKTMTPPRYISIHIRKGDYIKFIHKIPLLREFRRCQLDYYKKGILKLRTKYPDYPLLVCTDSPKWVSSLLSELDSNAILAPTIPNISPKFTDFVILLQSDALVISNSTFSWWAAYLNPGRIVICPSPWWDPSGFIGTSMSLDGPYLHYPDWYLFDTDTGDLIRHPKSTTGEKDDNNTETLNIYRLFRGMLL